MQLIRHRPNVYSAERTLEGWDLLADGHPLSSHPTFTQAATAAGADDAKRRRYRAVVQRAVVVAITGLLLLPVMTFREADNPDYPPARAVADRMEAAYREVDQGAADMDDFAVANGGLAGAVFEVDRGGAVADYNVLAGAHGDQCYIIRWVRFEVPFVGRLLPRYPCEPGQPALNFHQSGWEEIAVNLFSNKPLEWQPVLPDPIELAPWFFPAALVLLVLLLQQLISLSMVFLKPMPSRKVAVERIDPAQA